MFIVAKVHTQPVPFLRGRNVPVLIRYQKQIVFEYRIIQTGVPETLCVWVDMREEYGTSFT